MISENREKNKLKFLSLSTCSFLILIGFLVILPNYNQDVVYAQDSQINDSNIVSTGDIIVLDDDFLSIIKVDPVTGEQTLISDNSISSEINFEDVAGIAINSDGEIIVADEDAGCDLDGENGAVIKVDRNTGIRTLISDNCVSEVGLFRDLEAVAIDSENNIVVLDESGQTSLVILVNPNTGNHTLIYDSRNYPDLLADFEDLTIDSHGHIILAGKINGEPAIVRVNPSTGKHTIISNNRISPPGLLANPVGISLDKNGEILVIDDYAGPSLKSAVIKINPNTGKQSLLSHNEISDLDLLIKVKGIAVDIDGNIIVGDDDEKTVIKVDPKTGNQELISDNNISSNKLFDDIEDLVVFDPSSKKGTIAISNEKIQSIPDSPISLVAELLPIEDFDKAHDVRLVWIPPISNGESPIIWYEIQRREGTSSEGFGTYSFLARTSKTSFIDPVGLTILNYHYSYRVSATNLVGESEYSNSVFATLYRESYIPPLQQWRIGSLPEDIICNEDLVLLFSSFDKPPICVKPQSVEKLVERGWLR